MFVKYAVSVFVFVFLVRLMLARFDSQNHRNVN